MGIIESEAEAIAWVHQMAKTPTPGDHEVADPHPYCLGDDPCCCVQLIAAEQTARADEREKHQENNLMAECMDMVRDDLIRAGIISEEVPPMMLPEAIKRALKERVEAEREKCARIEPTPFEDDEGMVTC